jgi:hypothetical protein
MSSDDRKRYLVSTTIDQDFLDESQDNLLNELRMIAKIGIPPLSRTGVSYSNPTGNIVRATINNHRLKQGDTITISNASDGSLDGTHSVSVLGDDTFEFDAGAAFTLGTFDIDSDRFIYVSDRNMYVGDIFYGARSKFPVIKRTVGEFISPVLEFESLSMEINNSDEEFNDILQAGDDFSSWIGNRVTISMGLRDLAATYIPIFNGTVTSEAGYDRTVKSIRITARNDFDRINASFPSDLFQISTYPDLEEDKQNAIIPIVYGDWTANVEPDFASIPAIPVNGANANVNGDTDYSVNVTLVISQNPNTVFDTANVYLKRGDNAWLIPGADIVNVNANKNQFEIVQQSGLMTAITPETDNIALEFSSGDEFFVRVQGKSITGTDTNIVAIARDVLTTYGGLTGADFDASWATYEAKNTPTQSAISTFKARGYINETQQALSYALSLLEQVRLEAFVDRNLKIKLLSTHFEDFDPSPAYNVQNWDVAKDSFAPRLDSRNNFNRCKGQYNFLPNRNELFLETPILKNQAAINDSGSEVSKRILFPNLVDGTVVQNQVEEILKLTSSYLEHVDVALTWRALLLDIGDFIKLNVKIQSTQFDNVPAVIREIGYDPVGLKLVMRWWSLQMVPFPGWEPGFSGITGGYNATIEEA